MMTPKQLREALDARGLTTLVKAAAALRISIATVSRWRNGVDPIAGWCEVALRGIPLQRNGAGRAQSRSAVPSKSSK